jgi:hypothetical protein
MVSYKITHTKRRRQTKRNTKKKNAISRKNRMKGGYRGTKIYLDKTYNGQIWPEVDKPHGKGTMKWDNGDVYDGQWRYGKMSGRGTITWYDGTSYTGNWRSDKRNGFGTMKYKNSKIAKGNWLDDGPIGEFEIIIPHADPALPPTIRKIPAIDLDEVILEGDDESNADTEPEEDL